MQEEGGVSRRVYCKAWILGCCALQLVAFSPTTDGAAAVEGTRAIVRNLLEASDAARPPAQAAAGGEARLRGTLVACLGSLACVGNIDLGRSWREHKVRTPPRALHPGALCIPLDCFVVHWYLDRHTKVHPQHLQNYYYLRYFGGTSVAMGAC